MSKQTMSITMEIEKTVETGTLLPLGSWIYITDGRWYQAFLEKDGTQFPLEYDELAEIDANRIGIYRN